jgi:Fur family ferric uptake transcriptional regulator
MTHTDAHGCGRHRAPVALADLEGHLRRRSRRVTGPRQAILRVLRDQARPLTAREILAGLADGPCDLATVYRSLHMLCGLGLVCRLHFGDGACRFELADNPADGGHHHHHLICTRCAAVTELDSCAIEAMEQRVAEASGFKGVTHRLEFFGVCPGCQ